MLPRKCPACSNKSLSFNEVEIFCQNCPIYRKPLSFWQKPLVWAYTRYWWWRLPILVWFVVMLVQNLKNPIFAMNRLSNPFSALDFGMHELGHQIFSVFGEFMRIAGGSIFQCLFPLLWMIGFLQKRWYFAATMCWCWLGLNLFDVASYAADARARVLPLATGLAGLYEQGSDEVYDRAHDWYQLLSRTGHLENDLIIARGLRIAATTTFVTGFIFGGILLTQMVVGFVRRRSLGKQITPKDLPSDNTV